MTRPDGDTDVFEAHRPRLVRLAYRMLGSMLEAEDIVQEAWLRWRRADRDTVATPGAYLTRIVTRLCLDVLKSARARRETYIGPWLPEPVVEPDDDALRADEVTLTLMLALERLSPLERAAFLLHDVFDVPLGEVAATLDREPAAVRQLAARARKHVRGGRPRYQVSREEGARIAQAFFTASTKGDIDDLRGLLAENVVILSDGGGKVLAFRNPIVGLERALRLFAGLSRKFTDKMPSDIRPVWIDGLPGYISQGRGDVLQTTALEIEEGQIVAILHHPQSGQAHPRRPSRGRCGDALGRLGGDGLDLDLNARARKRTDHQESGRRVMFAQESAAHLDIVVQDRLVGDVDRELDDVPERHAGGLQDDLYTLEDHPNLPGRAVRHGAVEARADLTVAEQKPRVRRHFGRMAGIVAVGANPVAEGMNGQHGRPCSLGMIRFD